MGLDILISRRGPDGAVYASDRSRRYALIPEDVRLWIAAGAGGRRAINAGADGSICTAGNLITAFNPNRTLKWQFSAPYSRQQHRGGTQCRIGRQGLRGAGHLPRGVGLEPCVLSVICLHQLERAETLPSKVCPRRDVGNRMSIHRCAVCRRDQLLM